MCEEEAVGEGIESLSADLSVAPASSAVAVERGGGATGWLAACALLLLAAAANCTREAGGRGGLSDRRAFDRPVACAVAAAFRAASARATGEEEEVEKVAGAAVAPVPPVPSASDGESERRADASTESAHADASRDTLLLGLEAGVAARAAEDGKTAVVEADGDRLDAGEAARGSCTVAASCCSSPSV